MEAINNDAQLTDLGRVIAGLPVEPGLAVALNESVRLGVPHEMLTLVAMLSATESSRVFFSPKGSEEAAKIAQEELKSGFFSDHMDLICLFNKYAGRVPRDRRDWCTAYFINGKVMVAADEARQQLSHALRLIHPGSFGINYLPLFDYTNDHYARIMRCLQKGYPRQAASRVNKKFMTLSYPYSCLPVMDSPKLPEVYADISVSSSLFGFKPMEVLYHTLHCTNPYAQPTVTATMRTVSDVTNLF